MACSARTLTAQDPEVCEAPMLASLAKQAMLAEAELTPKPGLVDRRGSGAHSDLTLELMRYSAEAIEPYFVRMAEVSWCLSLGTSLRRELGAIGRAAEHAMFMATGGANTHKGAIWTLGLFVAAVNCSEGLRLGELARVAGSIARIPDVAGPVLMSHGEAVRRRFGAAGARGEACSDFPHITRVGIPALHRARRAGKSESASRLAALLSIMARLDDTCVLHRSGLEGLEAVKTGARAVLAAGGPETEAGDLSLRLLDRELHTKRISPGGAADLLAATLFLDRLCWSSTPGGWLRNMAC